MKKIFSVLCLCAIVLLLSACGNPTSVDVPNVVEEENGIEGVVEARPEEEDSPSFDTASIGQEEKQNWQDAYWEEITRAKTAATNAEMAGESVSYALYDMNKDGIPELMIRFGDCEANYEGRIYRFTDGACRMLGSVGLGHGSFWTDPQEEGMIVAYGHMGYCSALRMWSDAEGLQTESLYQMDLNEHPELQEYPTPAEYVAGSVRIPETRGRFDLPLRNYDKISMWLEGDDDFSSRDPGYPDEDSEFYSRLISEDGIVCAVSADGFTNTPGNVHFSELLEKDVIYPYMRSNVRLGETRTADLNGDGRVDCLLSLLGDEEDYMVILSEEDGVVYAYLFFCPLHFDALDRYGTFLSTEHTPYAFRFLFEGEQCVLIEVPVSLFKN